MFRLAKSVLDTVLGRKRPLDVDQDEQNDEIQKKQKTQEEIIHRIKVTNLPERELATVKKLFKGMGYNRVKKAPAWDYAFITVDSKEEADKCIEKINVLKFKNRLLVAVYLPDSQQDRRDHFANSRKSKKSKNYVDPDADTRTPAEKLSDQVTPLWKEPYETQLIKKNRAGLNQLTKLKRKIADIKDEELTWAFEKGNLPCEVLAPIGSPQVDGYRTKCEFTIGFDLTNKPTVGFLLGLYREGVTNVLEPSACKNVPEIAKKIAKHMGEYVEKSDLPVYDRVEKTGCWRTIMTKTQSTGDILILVQIRGAELTAERIQEEKENLIQYWSHANSGIKVTTLIFQIWDGHSNGITDKAPLEILTGDGYIYEEVLGCRFRLSASAFFQVNTPATELLYAKCAEWCSIDKNKKTTLLDLCCGTGTIGITMAKSVDRVIGIEMVPEAIVDAKANAKLNNIENVTYYAAKVEDKIDVVTNARNEEVIAVLDPPRNGVHASVIRAVREAQQIDRVVYISCDAKQALDNFVALCRPQSNRYKGTPFRPVRAVSIDLFPHSDPCELMIEFERIKYEEEDSNKEELVEEEKNIVQEIETTLNDSSKTTNHAKGQSIKVTKEVVIEQQTTTIQKETN